ncbi:MAG: phosphoribosylformylglycinamidine synthase subunit PurQ [Candidatus Omnitrophica bacterium]|nr:phosphoribosylformylglycinamidine synthase subunit PurQ [Candidatus Omnitrophota bacterium]
MKWGVVIFPGSNCDQDCFYVIKDVLGEEVRYVWHKETDLRDLDCLILPGGFSYGDYLRAGAIACFSPVMEALVDFAKKGGLIMGICNGFQILLEAGLLPGAMLRNKNIHFICKYVYLRVENIHTPFTNLFKEGQVVRIPIAHNEGNYYIEDEGLVELKNNKQIIFRYSDEEGRLAPEFNPNGAKEFIAGIINKEGNVLGMMPHPERASEGILNSQDGLLVFKSIVNWFKR